MTEGGGLEPPLSVLGKMPRILARGVSFQKGFALVERLEAGNLANASGRSGRSPRRSVP